MRQLKPLILLAVIVFAVSVWNLFAVSVWNRYVDPAPGSSSSTTASTPTAAPQPTSSRDHTPRSTDNLPAEAHDTLRRIAQGGPFPHRQDGTTFGNYEGLLPKQPRGYYREYTVETPRLNHRGARRIVTGGKPPAVWYYTDDHYRSFRRIEGSP